jgi:uncharacterized protein
MFLSRTQARALMLAAQGLHQRAGKKATRADVLRAIRRMCVLQIDTINVVARSPYLVLWSRLGDYDTRWLDELLAQGKLFEYWSHEACFLPVEDYRLYRQRMLNAVGMGWHYSQSWVESHGALIGMLLELIRERGAVRAADFERTDGKAGGWWEWKTEKRALEMLFTSGELMIARRQNFQRVYDLRERVLPSWDDGLLPSVEEVRRELALKAVRALGVAAASWVSDYFRSDKRQTLKTVEDLAGAGELLTVEIEGWKEPALVHPSNRRFLREASADEIKPELTTLLSPFDPLVWDRARAQQMFDFDYRLECYTPAPKRRYGYFTLPILHKGALAGRLDAKAHRKEGLFEVKALYLEPSAQAGDELVQCLATAIKECADWHKTPSVVVRHSEPASMAKRLSKRISPT